MAVLGLHWCVGFFLGVVCGGFSCCSQALEHRLNSYGTGLIPPQRVGSAWNRDGTRVSCIGRWILYHWATKEAPRIFLKHSLSVQFSSVTQPCSTLCDPMDCSTPGLTVHHQLLEFNQTHAHWVGDAIQSAHPLSSPSPCAFNLSQHQSLFK